MKVFLCQFLKSVTWWHNSSFYLQFVSLQHQFEQYEKDDQSGLAPNITTGWVCSIFLHLRWGAGPGMVSCGHLCLRQAADWSVYWPHHPVLLLEERLVRLQMDDCFCVKPHPALLVPLVVKVDPTLQFCTVFPETCWAGRLEVDRVQTLLGETRVLWERGEELLHHSAGAPSWLGAQSQRAAVRWGVAALVAVVGGRGGLAHGGAAVHAGAERVAADAVLTGAEAAAGRRCCGRFADRAAGALQTAGRFRAHQGGGKLAGVVGQVHVYGCCGDDTGQVRDPHVYNTKQRTSHCAYTEGCRGDWTTQLLLTAARLTVVLTDVVVHVILAVMIWENRSGECEPSTDHSKIWTAQCYCHMPPVFYSQLSRKLKKKKKKPVTRSTLQILSSNLVCLKLSRSQHLEH